MGLTVREAYTHLSHSADMKMLSYNEYKIPLTVPMTFPFTKFSIHASSLFHTRLNFLLCIHDYKNYSKSFINQPDSTS